MQIDSLEELAGYLLDFETWDHRGGYDFGGMVSLLGACMDNLRKHALEAELPERLERSQLFF